MKKIVTGIFIVAFAFMQFGCTAYDAMKNAQRLQFKLGSVSGLSVGGVDLSRVSSLSNINPLDMLKLTSAFAAGKLPASFTLNLIAKNPNDGTGGTTSTSAVIKKLDWRLLIDSKETISGTIGNSIEIPGIGQATTIPVAISLDLLEFFKNEGVTNILNMATGIGGSSGSSARLTLKINPTIDTFLGGISPGEISVIDKEFRSQ
ncbi:MAG: hypothetical protein QG635_717 [Bacteroidota bacterium]|nr:hypothetical protein [Bacteroidota bacterium]